MNETSQAFTRGRTQGYDAGLKAGRVESDAKIKTLEMYLASAISLIAISSDHDMTVDAILAAAKETT